VIKSLATGTEGPRVQNTACALIFQKLSPSGSKWVPNSLQSWEGEDRDEEEWRPISLAPLLVQVGFGPLATTFPHSHYKLWQQP